MLEINKYLVAGDPELDSTSPLFIKGAKEGDWLWGAPDLYINDTTHKWKVISLGVNNQGEGLINHYSNGISKAFKGAGSGDYVGPIGENLWIRGDKIDSYISYCDIKGAADRYVKITNVGKVTFTKVKQNAWAFNLFGGCTYWDFFGQNGEMGPYSHGKWDITFIHKDPNPTAFIQIGSRANHFKVRNIEVYGMHHSFCNMMIKTNDVFDYDMYGELDNIFSWASKEGELWYIGQTKGQSRTTPRSAHRVIIKATRLYGAEAGAEMFQVNQLEKGSIVDDITLVGGSMARRSPFTDFQISGAQFFSNGGGIDLSNITVDGYAANVIIKSSRALEDIGGGQLTLRNFKIAHGCGNKAFYIDFYNDPDLNFKFENGLIENISMGMSDVAAVDNKPARIVDTASFVTDFTVQNVTYPQDQPFFDPKMPATKIHITAPTSKFTREYVKSGWETIGIHNVYGWTPTYGKGHPLVGQQVNYKKDEVACLDGLYYRAIQDHSDPTPPNQSTLWKQVWWDDEGNTDDSPSFKAPKYSYPIYDLRLKPNIKMTREQVKDPKGNVYALADKPANPTTKWLIMFHGTEAANAGIQIVYKNRTPAKNINEGKEYKCNVLSLYGSLGTSFANCFPHVFNYLKEQGATDIVLSGFSLGAQWINCGIVENTFKLYFYNGVDKDAIWDWWKTIVKGAISVCGRISGSPNYAGALNIPYVAIHGDKDEKVSWWSSRHMVDDLSSADKAPQRVIASPTAKGEFIRTQALLKTIIGGDHASAWNNAYSMDPNNECAQLFEASLDQMLQLSVVEQPTPIAEEKVSEEIVDGILYITTNLGKYKLPLTKI